MPKSPVYLFDALDALPADFALSCRHLLPKQRLEQLDRLRQPLDKLNCVLGYLLLAKALKAEYNICKPISFRYSNHGKPYLDGIDGIYFSISHCKYGAAVAVSEQEIGLDMQDIRPYDADLARRICGEDELKRIEKSPDKASELIKIWTEKESFAKRGGASVSSVLRQDLPEDCFQTIENDRYILTLCI